MASRVGVVYKLFSLTLTLGSVKNTKMLQFRCQTCLLAIVQLTAISGEASIEVFKWCRFAKLWPEQEHAITCGTEFSAYLFSALVSAIQELSCKLFSRRSYVQLC